MKKTIIVIFTILVIIMLFRYVLGNNTDINLMNIIEELGRQGEITSINSIFQDAQKLKYNFLTIQSFFTTSDGENYTEYIIKTTNYTETGERLIDEIKPIKNGQTFFVFSKQEIKGAFQTDETDIFSTVKKIANNIIVFFKMIYNSLKYSMFIAIDVLKCIIESLSYTIKLIASLITA